MKSALIGHTGFVGGNLLRQWPFTDCFNSKNIESMHGQSFDLVVCAGVRAEKWKANQNPIEDRRLIDGLLHSLGQIKAGEFILISTVDVFPDPKNVYEDTLPDWTTGMPYGVHRRLVEEFVSKKFRSRIIRLPGLYGTGLKKNVIYDLLHQNRLDAIHADGQFQFYGLDRLGADLERMREEDLQLLHAVTEPVTVREVAREAFGLDFQNRTPAVPSLYDIRTRHAARFGGAGAYVESKADVLKNIKAFVARS